MRQLFCPQGLRNCFRAPFLPNSVFGFIVTPWAFHGVQEIKGARGWRRNIMMNLYHSYAGSCKSAIKQQLIPTAVIREDT
jgi:hypothetical protein